MPDDYPNVRWQRMDSLILGIAYFLSATLTLALLLACSWLLFFLLIAPTLAACFWAFLGTMAYIESREKPKATPW